MAASPYKQPDATCPVSRDAEGTCEAWGVRRRSGGRGLDAPSKPSQSFGQGHWHKSSAGTEGPLALKKPMAVLSYGTE